MFFKFFLLFFIIFCGFKKSVDCNDEVKFLIQNFFDNLQEEYKNVINVEPSENLKMVIDERIDDFLTTVYHDPETDRKDFRTKRDLKKLLNIENDDGVYIFQGVEGVSSIPVIYPQDICLFTANHTVFAAALNNENENTFLSFFVKQNQNFRKVFQFKINPAITMDCISFENSGFVIVSTIINKYTLDTEGSQIFQITDETSIKSVQTFAAANQKFIRLWVTENIMYLIQSYKNDKTTVMCPIYKWSGFNFNIIDELPCHNAVSLEPFTVLSDLFIAVANYDDNLGGTKTYSSIYKYNENSEKFNYYQPIRTQAVLDIKYFNFEKNNLKEHFLFVANSFEKDESGQINYDTFSVVYKYVNGNFTPFQSIKFDKISKVMSVKESNGQFVLFVSCENTFHTYQYNGWKLIESSIKFDYPAFGTGISSMRHYDMDKLSLIVIANKNQDENSINIFKPFYDFKNHLKSLFLNVENWCQDNLEKLGRKNLDELLFKLQNIPKIEETNSKVINLENAEIGYLETETLKTPKASLDKNLEKNINKTFRYLKRLETRLTNLEINKNKTTTNSGDNNLRQSLESNTKNGILRLNELIIENSLDAKFLNGFPSENLLRSNKDLKLPLTSIYAPSVVMKNGLYIKNKLNGIQYGRGHNVRRRANAHNNFQQIIVDEIELFGLLNNDVKLEFLDKYALKLSGVQNITGQLNIENLECSSVRSGIISGRSINDVVLISNGSFFSVNQDIQFSKLLMVKNLVVNDRINNINIKKKKLDVLLKKANYLQIVTGHKIFESVKLINSFELKGKIKSTSLDRMNPIVTIADDLTIQGDYEINGDVRIKRILKASNIYGESGTYNINDLFNFGLKKESTESDLVFQFNQPIQSNNLQSPFINNINITDLVTSNENVQKITGSKIFTGNLKITDGFCDILNLNGINIRHLNETILKKSGNQIISGKIHFKKIIASKTIVENSFFSEYKFSDYLTSNTEQIIPAKVTILGTVNVENSIECQSLKTNNKIFGYDFDYIIRDTARHGINSVVTGDKYFKSNITFGTIFPDGKLLGVDVKDIVRDLSVIKKDVVINGPVRFKKNMSIKNINVDLMINSISREHFGKIWLLSESNQTFTAPQFFKNVKTTENINLLGNLNGLNVGECFQNCYWLNQSEFINHAIFANELSSTYPVVVNGLISGIKLSTEAVLSKRNYLQEINGKIIVKYLTVDQGGIDVNETLNDVRVHHFNDYLNSENQNLIITDSVNFLQETHFDYLNDYQMDDFLSNMWISGEDVEITGQYNFQGDTFIENIINTSGKMNEVSLKNLAEKYFSLSKTQEISSKLKILGQTQIEGNLRVERMFLNGSIESARSGLKFNLEDFNDNVLKIGKEQLIRGVWTMDKVYLSENQMNLKINGLNLQNDVMRYDVDLNTVTATKTFENLNVNKIRCSNCIIQGVDINDWSSRSVYTNGNFKIEGITTLENSVINDLRVHGLVNNMSFIEGNLLTSNTNQIINTNVYITSGQPTIIDDLEAETVNQRNVEDFFNNLVVLDELASDKIVIDTNLEFINPVQIKNLDCQGTFYGLNFTELNAEMEAGDFISKYKNEIQEIDSTRDLIMKSIKNRAYFLDHYVHIQTLPIIKPRKCLSLRLPFENRIQNFLAIWNQNQIWFYGWSERDKQFIFNDLKFPIIKMEIVNIDKISFEDMDYLYIELFDKIAKIYRQTMFSYLDYKFIEYHTSFSITPSKISTLTLAGNICVGFYSEFLNDININCIQNMKLSWNQKLVSGQIKYVEAVCNSLVILTMSGSIEIWRANQENIFQQQQIIQVFNPSSISTICFQEIIYIAICSESTVNSLHYGQVEIYKSPTIYSEFQYFQTIRVAIPVQTKFSILPSSELILYVLTKNPKHSMIAYSYKGVYGFKEFVVGSTIPKGDSLSVLKDINSKKEFVGIISNENVLIIEAVLVN